MNRFGRYVYIYISLDTWIHFKWISKSNQFLPPRFLLEALMSAINVELGKVRSSKQKAGAQCNMEPTCLRPFSLESFSHFASNVSESFRWMGSASFRVIKLHLCKGCSCGGFISFVAFLPPRSCMLFFWHLLRVLDLTSLWVLNVFRTLGVLPPHTV